MDTKRRSIRVVTNLILNIIYYISIAIFGFVILRIFVFGSYKIPTDSMEPTILPGDYILVNKLAYGARLFNMFDALDAKKVKIRRMPGFSPVKNNDVIVFHIPHPHKKNKIEMDMHKYYIKRCIGIPGDTLRIINGLYNVNSDKNKQPGNLSTQLAFSAKPESAFPKNVFNAFPKDSLLKWNIKNFGPLYIPRRGDVIELNRTNALLYKKIIEWEKGYRLTLENDSLLDHGQNLSNYKFTHNYYFMGGDKVENSQDSRYWGLLPDELIVGKASLIWKSEDPYSGKLRKNRLLKKIE